MKCFVDCFKTQINYKMYEIGQSSAHALLSAREQIKIIWCEFDIVCDTPLSDF